MPPLRWPLQPPSFRLSGDNTLVPLHLRHTMPLFQEIQNARTSLARWLPWVPLIHTPEDLAHMIHIYQERARQTGAQSWSITSGTSPVGMLSMNYIDWHSRATSLGYWLGEGHRGQGLVRQAVGCVIPYVFEHLHLNTVEISCAADNLASQNIPRALGFLVQACAPANQWVDGSYVDLVTYRLERAEKRLKT